MGSEGDVSQSSGFEWPGIAEPHALHFDLAVEAPTRCHRGSDPRRSRTSVRFGTEQWGRKLL